MHKYILIICFLIMQPAFADENTDRINWIKKEYKSIRENLSNYSSERIDDPDDYSVDGLAGGYVTKNGEVKLIEVGYYSYRGKGDYEFYYSNNEPFFIFNKHYRYNTDYTMTKEVVEEWYKQDGVRQEVFDPNKTQIEEYRYYIYKNKIIKTIKSKNVKEISSREQKHALELSLEMLKRLNKQIQPTPKSGAAD